MFSFSRRGFVGSASLLALLAAGGLGATANALEAALENLKNQTESTQPEQEQDNQSIQIDTSKPADDEEVYVKDAFDYVVRDGCSVIVGYTGAEADLDIPSELDGYPVLGIGDSVFAFCYSLTSIVIPASVTSIGEAVFNGCINLTDITADQNNQFFTSIDGVLFDKTCETLIYHPANKVEESGTYAIPDSVTSIGDDAFAYCDSLTSIAIPDSVTSIGEDAFSYCESLTSINISDSVTSIGDGVFNDCSTLTSIQVSVDNDSYADIDGILFEKASKKLMCYPAGNNESSYLIPAGIVSIGDYAFDGCQSLTSVAIPDSVTSIGDYAFVHCDSLTSIDIPASVTSIGDYAFASCDSLTSIAIPDSVTSIGEDAFSYCESLTSIAIPDSVTSIGEGAFNGAGLATITVDPDNQFFTDIDGVLFDKNCETLICHPAGKVEESGTYAIPQGVVTIGDHTFLGCSSLTSISIPDSVTSIGDYAFYHCESLTSISIPDSVTSISDYAFAYCASLTSIAIPASVAYISEDAFDGSPVELIVERDSYAAEWAKAGGYAYDYTDALDWLNS